MTVRADYSLKKQLTDATLVDSSNNEFLDNAGNESVTRQKTRRSLRHAVRVLMADASDEDQYLHTLAGAQVAAMVTEAGTTPTDAMEYVHAISGVVTGGPSTFADTAPDADLTAHNWKQMISDMTVLYTDGKYYIDDVGTTGLYRPKAPASLKQALRRVVSETATSGVYKLNTLSGKLLADIADLPVAGPNISGITSILTTFDAATTTSASSVSALDGPSASHKQILGAVLRARTSGSNRNVYIEDVGDNVTDSTKTRYSYTKLVRDAMTTDGATIITKSGMVTSGLSGLNYPSVSAFISKAKAAVL